jgi:hypothetical protein
MVGYPGHPMKIRIEDGLPYVSATLNFRNEQASFDRILIDTGSGGSVFSADSLSPIGLKLEPHDPIQRIRGVGGTEFVFIKKVNWLALGRLQAVNIEIEVGAMDYGIKLDGIIGMDFLMVVNATIDLKKLEIY